MDNNEKLFNLVSWFNNFGDQVNLIYDKISLMIRKEFGIKEVPKRYVNYIQVKLSIPTYFCTAFRKDNFSIDILTNIGEGLIKNKEYNQPSINVFCQHLSDDVIKQNNYMQYFLPSIDSSIKKDKDGIFKGKINYNSKEISYNAFQVPLDKFDGFDADDVIMTEIIDRLKIILSNN